MEFIRMLSFVCIVVITCWHSIQAVSLEPEFTKYQFIEQIIERMVRMSDKMDDFVKKMDNYQNNMDQWKDKMEGINRTATQTLLDIEANNREFKSNLTAVNKQFLDEITAWRGDTDSALKQKSRDLETDIQHKLNQGTAAVAFNAFSHNSQTVGFSIPVVFDQIRLNTCGDCYNTNTGVFTAPLTGIYQFNSQLCANNKDTSDLDYKIVVGGKDVLHGEYRAPPNSDDENCAAFSVIIDVNKGQAVSVRVDVALHAGSHSELSFSGVLLKTR